MTGQLHGAAGDQLALESWLRSAPGHVRSGCVHLASFFSSIKMHTSPPTAVRTGRERHKAPPRTIGACRAIAITKLMSEGSTQIIQREGNFPPQLSPRPSNKLPISLLMAKTPPAEAAVSSPRGGQSLGALSLHPALCPRKSNHVN